MCRVLSCKDYCKKSFAVVVVHKRSISHDKPKHCQQYFHRNDMVITTAQNKSVRTETRRYVTFSERLLSAFALAKSASSVSSPELFDEVLSDGVVENMIHKIIILLRPMLRHTWWCCDMHCDIVEKVLEVIIRDNFCIQSIGVYSSESEVAPYHTIPYIILWYCTSWSQPLCISYNWTLRPILPTILLLPLDPEDPWMHSW